MENRLVQLLSWFPIVVVLCRSRAGSYPVDVSHRVSNDGGILSRGQRAVSVVVSAARVKKLRI